MFEVQSVYFAEPPFIQYLPAEEQCGWGGYSHSGGVFLYACGRGNTPGIFFALPTNHQMHEHGASESGGIQRSQSLLNH